MFGKIKGKLKNVFSKSEEEIFVDEDVQELEEEKESLNKEEEQNIEETKEEETVESKDIVDDESLDKEEGNIIDEEVKSEKKKGFFGRIFGKSEEEKEEEDEKELEKLEEDMLEDVPKEEKEAIIEDKEIPEEIIKERKKEVEKELEIDEDNNKEELIKFEKKEEIDIPKPPKIDVESQIEEEIVIEEKIEQNEKEFDEEVIKENEEELDVKQEETKDKDSGFFSKTFGKLASKKISEDDFSKLWIELEIFLLEINIAFEIVQRIEEKLRNVVIEEKFNRFSLSEKIREVMIEEVKEVMIQRESDLLEKINEINKKGEIARIVVLGVNGTGKTTTIAKFVNFLQKNNKSLVVAAADTFRAAAVEQLDEHSKKLNFKLIQHKGGSDPAAVAFDAIEHAKAKKLDVVIVDTAGRMPNNSNLMQELAKIERITKTDINLFVGDSISGNDLVEQIELFDKVVGITGMILTKTDTDERPGSVVTAAFTIDKPIYYLGIGQGYDDLIKFDAKLVAEKLFELE